MQGLADLWMVPVILVARLKHIPCQQVLFAFHRGGGLLRCLAYGLHLRVLLTSALQ